MEPPVKKIIILVVAILLTGCGAKDPLYTSLKLGITGQPAGIYSGDIAATLRGRDARKDKTVVAYQLKGQTEIRIPNESDPHALITDQLAKGFLEQGLVFEGGAPIRILIDLNELLAKVTRSKLLYNAIARSHLTLTIKYREVTFTKTYDREASQGSARRTPVKDLEKMLNDQLTDIVTQILNDQEVRATINGK